MITLKNVSKYYYNKGIIASGFSKVNLTLNMGEFVAITGESGSGKSTLLNVISGLDSYEEGEMYINGKETSHYTEEDFESYRKKYISNIFQNFNLVNSYTVKQNIELVLLFNGEHGKSVQKKVMDLIKKVGLTKYKNTKVSKLSGGQKQRVAIARALAKDTPIIIADEPTGNLDSKSAKGVLELLHDISKDKLVIIVTHNYEQIEKYVTRKIKMHDGKILEDKVIEKKAVVDYQEHYDNKKISFLSLLRLGIRNAFNIVPKFVLVLMVYLFITIAVTTEYAFFKKQEYETSSLGYNNFFRDTKDTRIIVKKGDKSPFSDEDYDKLRALEYVGGISKNDILVDSSAYVTDNENLYLDGFVKELDTFKGNVSVGVMPTNDNELLLVGSKDNYYLNQLKDKVIGSSVVLNIGEGSGSDKQYKIVGISYVNDNDDVFMYSDGYIYAKSKVLEELQFSMNQQYSDLRVFFNKEWHVSNVYDSEYRIIPNQNVGVGEAFVSEDWNMFCGNSNCLHEKMDIEVKNLYYEDKVSLKVSRLYQKKNIQSLLGEKDFNRYNGAIYISNQDYQKLFMHGVYQCSVYVDDVNHVEMVSNSLNQLGYQTLKIKDTIYSVGAVEALKIFRTVITAILIITLFFISYFVIRIILKSRNVYFGTIRILGASKKNAKHLLEIELLTVSHIAYLVFIMLLYFHRMHIVKIGFANTIIKYFSWHDYIILYIVITIMSYLISVRFCLKIFKNSAMNTLREEV